MLNSAWGVVDSSAFSSKLHTQGCEVTKQTVIKRNSRCIDYLVTINTRIIPGRTVACAEVSATFEEYSTNIRHSVIRSTEYIYRFLHLSLAKETREILNLQWATTLRRVSLNQREGTRAPKA